MNYNNISSTRNMTGRDACVAKRHTHSFRHRRQCYILLGVAVVILIICGISLLLHKTVSSASARPPIEKCFRSVEIQPGDSLWSIASDYYTEEWGSIANYIEEIKVFNGIFQEQIHFGDYLMIPYYISAE